MISFFRSQDHHEDDAMLDEIRGVVSSLEKPEPPPGVLARVLGDRARGERVILPAEDERVMSRLSARWLVAAAMTLLVGATLVTVMRWSRDGKASSSVETFASTGSLIRSADAGELPSRPQPSAPPLTFIDGARLRVGRLEYAQRWTDSAGRQVTDSRSVFEVVPVALDGQPAWRVSSVVNGNIGAHGERTEAETLLVARSDLHLLRRQVHASPYNGYSRINIAQLFHGDSVMGRMTAEGRGGATRPIAQQLPAAFAPYMTETLAPLMLTTTTLSKGWRRSVSLLGWAVVPRDLFTSVELRVVGEETITVPAGRFDCWRLELIVGQLHIGYWVRKSDGVGVLTRDESKKATRGVRELLLVAEK